MRIELLLSAIAMATSAFCGVDFSSRLMLVGKASFAGDCYVVKRTVGAANFSPELQLPIELVYDSSCEKTGMFGFAWRSPQLESSAI